MTPAALEALLRVALPPLKLAVRERYLEVRRRDPAAVRVAAEELAPASGSARRWREPAGWN